MNTATAAPELQLVEAERPAAALPAVQQPSLPAVVTPADVLRVAMETGDKDIDRLERLMAMQERYLESQERERKRQAELAFWRDFAAFRAENIIVPKTKHVDRGRAGSFDQAEYHVAAQMLSPALAKHGFSFRHDMKFGAKPWTTDGVVNDQPWVFVTCYLSHRDGHIEKLDLEGPPGDLQANTPVQNMQVTGSFLKRQSLLAITGTATGGEDDENAMRRRPARTEPQDEARDVSEFERLQTEGRDKAMEGSKPLTEWWGKLTAKQRGLMNSEFGAMRRAAAQVDREAGRG